MRRFFSFVAKAAVSVLLLYFALRGVDLATVKDRLAQVTPGWIALELVVLFIQLCLAALRWRRVIQQCGADISYARSFIFSIAGIFFNQTLPSSVGGDAVRIWLLGRLAGWRSAFYSVFVDRIIGLVALAILVVVCLPWSFQLIASPVGRAALVLIGFGCIAGGAVFVVMSWPRLGYLQRWAPTRHLAAAASAAARILSSPRVATSVFGLSIVIQLLTAVAAWCAAKSVGAPITLFQSVILVPPVVLVSVVPISIAGWGVREGAMVMAFHYAGLLEGDGLIISLLFGAGNLLLGIIGGIVWVLSSERPAGSAIAAAGGGEA